MSAKDRLTTRQIKANLESLRDLVFEACADAEVELHEAEAASELVEGRKHANAEVRTLAFRFNALDRLNDHLEAASKSLERAMKFDQQPEAAGLRSYSIMFLDQVGWDQIRVHENLTLTAHAKGVTITSENDADAPFILTYGDIEVDCGECMPTPVQARWIIDSVRNGKDPSTFYWIKNGSDWQPGFLAK